MFQGVGEGYLGKSSREVDFRTMVALLRQKEKEGVVTGV